MKRIIAGKIGHVSKVDRFWNEIALHDSVYNMYDEEAVFISLLAGFVGTRINAGDCNVLIASKAHLEKLAEKLRLHGIYVSYLTL